MRRPVLTVAVLACSIAGVVCLWLGFDRASAILVVAGIFAALAAFYGAIVLVETRRRP